MTTPEGDVVVSQLGGTVDGLTMRSWPAPELLVPGMRVQLAVHEAPDLALRMHVVIDDAHILARPPAPAFVRTGPTKAGHSLYWESGCIFLVVDPLGTKAVPASQATPAIDASIATWNDDTVSCSYMKLMQQAPPKQNVGDPALEVGKDGMNLLKIRDASWCRPANGEDPARCYPDAAAGITTAVFVDDAKSSRDGAIVDADIELNGVGFAIAVAGQTLSQLPCKAELQNTQTHELGHLHGLEHTCLAAGDPGRVDDQGNPVPDCVSTSDPKIVDATMYPFQDCGETKKETLEPDDINSMCVIYPTAKDPGTCEAPGGSSGGCCSATGSPSEALLLAAATSALVLARRRRRTR